VVGVANTFACEHLRQRFLDVTRAAVSDALGRAAEVAFVLHDDRPAPHPTAPPAAPRALPGRRSTRGRSTAWTARQSAAVARVHPSPADGSEPAAAQSPLPLAQPEPARAMHPTPLLMPDAAGVSHELNPRYVFETFVVGPPNQLAYAAAQQVAATPGQSYNPLLIYGGVGLGKTHLLHAIGQSALSRGLSVAYVTAERFTNEIIGAIRSRTTDLFRARYRAVDVLLVDDVQFIAGKESTEEEFFHTFNALHEANKQIVLTSDCVPQAMRHLHDRLRSRFAWGLIADIQPPDLETKMAILDKKSEAEGIKLPDDVRSFMASKTKSNVRELEGALIKLMAYSSLTGVPINLPMTQQVLKHLVHVQDRKVTIDSIQKAVAERFQIKQSQIKEKSNTKKVVYPRQVAMYLAKELTSASLPEIGRAFGGKHHTTVIHSIHKIEETRHTNPELNRLLHSLMDSLQ